MPRTAKQMQQATVEPPSPHEEPRVRITARTPVGFEYHLSYPVSVVRDLLDPDVDDGYLEIPVPAELKNTVKHRYLHTTQIAEVDVCDEMPTGGDTAKLPAGKAGERKAG